MSKSIKVSKENAAAIEAVLHAANGKSYSHAYTSFAEIVGVANFAEQELTKLLGGKTNWTGATVHDRSGGELPNSYKYSRQCTAIKLERKSTGWFLSSASSVLAYKEAGKTSLVLTQKQDELAIAKLRKAYTVAKTATV